MELTSVVLTTIIIYLLICEGVLMLIFANFVFSTIQTDRPKEFKKFMVRAFWYACPVVNLYTLYLFVKQYKQDEKSV